jgi:hypothetical protein
MAEDALRRYACRVVFIGGGPPVWQAYARLSATGTHSATGTLGVFPMTGRPTAGSPKLAHRWR